MEFTPYTLPWIAAAAMAFGLAVFVPRYRNAPGRITFSALMLAVFVWSACYALEISALAEPTKVFWAKVQYFGIAAIPLLWLRFVIYYVGERVLTAGYVVLLSIVPALTLSLVWLTDSIRVGTDVDRSLGFPMPVFEYGPGLWIFAAYSYLLVSVGTLILLRAIVRLPHLGSRHAAVMLFAALAPWAANVMYLTGSSPFALFDPTSLGFALTGLVVAWGMGRVRFLSTAPVAHRAIREGAKSGVIALDTADNVVELNPAAERMFGVSADDAIGRAAAQVFADRPQVLAWLTAPREATVRGSLESGGAARELDVRTTLLYDRRRHAGRLVTFRDVSELAAAEHERDVAKEVAETAGRSKSEFLANVSHEIRTPLNAIMGMTDLVLEGEMSAEQRDRLQTARSSADSLLSIINDILDFSKIESHELELESAPFDVRDLVEDTIKMMAVTAAGKSLRLSGKVAEDVPRVVVGDSLRLRQVLINLVSNAIKFTSEGEVGVDVRLDDDAETADGQCRLLFAVTDTGVGIDPEDIARIFESFAQADASTTRDYGGMGIGLSIASYLVHLMEGEIEVESEVGEGSRFTFSIVAGVSAVSEDAAVVSKEAEAATDSTSVPVEASSDPTPVPAEVVIDFGDREATAAASSGADDGDRGTGAAELPDLGRLHVLVADDNIINQRMASAVLESRGHSVEVVGDGREVLEAMADASFDMVLMDIQMPNLDGIEATRSIRSGEQWTGKHVPIIAITAHAMKGDRERFLEAGVDAYVPKPLDAALLFETMAQLLEGSGAGDAPETGGEQVEDTDEPAEGAAAVAENVTADDDETAIEGAVINRDVALAKLGGDQELLVEIIDLYLEDSPKVLDMLRAAVAERDAEAIWKSAHRLKGSVGSLSAERAFAAADALESLGREGDLAAVAEGLAALERETEALAEALSELRAEVAG